MWQLSRAACGPPNAASAAGRSIARLNARRASRLSNGGTRVLRKIHEDCRITASRTSPGSRFPRSFTPGENWSTVAKSLRPSRMAVGGLVRGQAEGASIASG